MSILLSGLCCFSVTSQYAVSAEVEGLRQGKNAVSQRSLFKRAVKFSSIAAALLSQESPLLGLGKVRAESDADLDTQAFSLRGQGYKKGSKSALIKGNSPSSIDSKLQVRSLAKSSKKSKKKSKSCKTAFKEDRLILPQFDSDVGLENRKNRLEKNRERFKNVKRYHKYDLASSEAFELIRGPELIPGSDAYHMALLEANDINQRIGRNLAADEKMTKLLLSGAVPTQTVDDLANMFKAFEPEVPAPLGLSNWKDDASFGDMRRTYLGQKLRGLDSELFDLDLNAEDLAAILGHDKGLAATKLYGIDLMMVKKFNAADGRNYFVPGVQAMFFVDAHDRLMPLAIKLDTGLVYTPLDQDDEWMLAKLSLSVAELTWLSAIHFTETHLINEGIRVEMLRHLDRNHPVHALLEHHFKNMFGNSLLGLNALFTKGTTLDEISGWGAEGYTKFFANESIDGADFSHTLAKEISEQSLESLPNLRRNLYMGQVNKELRRFVGDYLQHYYGCNGNKNVKNDFELQNWAKAVADEQGANIKNFPDRFDSVEDLADAVSHIIYLITIKHHTMNASQMWHGTSIPGASFALWKPLPLEKGGDVKIRDFLPPDALTILKQAVLIRHFLWKLDKEESILYSYIRADLGESAASELREYQKGLLKVQDKMIEEEESKELIYKLVVPENLPGFIWI